MNKVCHLTGVQHTNTLCEDLIFVVQTIVTQILHENDADGVKGGKVVFYLAFLGHNLRLV